jgi:hypothetical protein
MLMKIGTLFLGAEFFFVRYAPGVGFTFALLVALSLKQWLFQYLPVTEGHAMLLQLATGLNVFYLVFGAACRRIAYQHNQYIDAYHSGAHILSFFGEIPVKAVLHTVEPLACFLVAGLAAFSIIEDIGTVMPWWVQIGIQPEAMLPNPWHYLPVWFDAYVEWCALGYVALAWVGFVCHAKCCDWPETDAYRREQRAIYEAQAPRAAR